MASCILTTTSAEAACSAGIPCTDYDIANDTDADRDPGYNGPKSGEPFLSPLGLHDEGSCDGNFMNQIYARAFLEASREVIMSEQLIHKPDSVLEYTCFDQLVGYAADAVGPVFSEKEYWRDHEMEIRTADTTATEAVTITHLDDDLVDDMLEPFLFDILEEYLNGSFSHSFMGNALSIDHTISSSAMRNISYSCSNMNAVWQIAKCADFAEDDRFRSFSSLIESDPRSIPQMCSDERATFLDVATPDGNPLPTASGSNYKLDQNISAGSTNPSGGISDPCPAEPSPPFGTPADPAPNNNITYDIIDLANNCDKEVNNPSGPGTIILPNAYSSVDMIETFKKLILGVGQHLPGAGNATGTIACPSSPLPTGLPVVTHVYTDISGSLPEINSTYTTVNRVSFVHEEYFCPNPGCYYQPVLKIPYDPLVPLPDLSSTRGVCVPIP